MLWPEVIDAVAPTPVLAAGGIGTGRQMAAALAMGAQGVWTGSLWLTVEEADVPPAQMQACFERDEPRHGALAVLDGQALPHAAQRLDRGMGARRHARSAGHAAAVHGRRRRRVAPSPVRRQGASECRFNPVGQIVGQMSKVRKVKDVIYDMVEECIESTERLESLMSRA